VTLPPKKKKLKEREECEMLKKVLLTFQGQVLGKTAGVCECHEGIQKLEPGQNIHQLSMW
jgi:hypothetical protein